MDILLECLRRGTSPVTTVSFAKEYLKKAGFEELYYDTVFAGKEEGCYYISPFPDLLFAFTMGKTKGGIQSMRMAFAHVDQPAFQLKGKPEFQNKGCAQLNVEVYGGMMEHTWFDRPLGLAGRVILRGEDAFHPQEREYESGRPVAVIPGIAIHMQREANNGWKIDRQKELMPVVGLSSDQWSNGGFLRFLADELQVEPSEILSYDLTLYNHEQPQLCGIHNEILTSPRLDNLVSVSALLEALTKAQRDDGINFVGLFNHEEVGSFTKSGADSEVLKETLAQIFSGKGCSPEIRRASMARSTYLSVDGAHAAHPNYPDRCDPTTHACLGKGTVIKRSGTQKYASDCRMYAIIRELAQESGIPIQESNDRNTIRGGTTLGPMIGSHLSMMGCDIGVPMLAMHSARETMAVSDYESLRGLVTAFFS